MKAVWRRIGIGLSITGVMSGGFVAGRMMRGQMWERPARAATRQFAQAGNPVSALEDKPNADGNALPADVFDEALERIQRDFALDAPDATLLDKAMLTRLVAGLNDPATRLLSPSAEEARRAALLGYQTGIGANLTLGTSRQGDVTRRTLLVQSVVWGSPAQSAGLKTGDRLVEIDRQWIIGTLQPEPVRASLPAPPNSKGKPGIPNGITLAAAREKLMAGKDEVYTLVVERVGEAKPLSVEVRSAAVQSPAAAFQWREAGIGHLSVRQCSRQSASFVEETLQTHGDELRGLIVDLRQCSGGVETDSSLPEINGRAALQSLVSHLTAGGTAVSLQTRIKIEPLAISGKGKPSYPVVVVVDKGTANLGEAAASALRDLGKFPVVGTTTWGDDVLSFYALLPHGGIEIAAAHLRTASGKPMDKGIVPDIPAAPENALDMAVKTLKAERKANP